MSSERKGLGFVWDRWKLLIVYCTVICTGVVASVLWQLIPKVGR